ncbi:MAG: VWA domain-containing protein [Candidatus Dormibacteria bacterium]
MSRRTFPFSAIVGQERMKLALLLNAVNPAIGGVLIRGERGTAKSTTVRALAALLPEHLVVDGCAYGCDPDPRLPAAQRCDDCNRRSRAGPLPAHSAPMRVIDLPINASEDRVVGAIDIEAALRGGRRQFEPGLLASAHRNILYIDEVNLLDDHLVDVVLDSAASGVNVVEREGVSVRHPARFILVGTMNPGEGELRPQLLDRFGLCVDVSGLHGVEDRVEVVEREERFRRGEPGFDATYAAGDRELAARVVAAAQRLGHTHLTAQQSTQVAHACLAAGALGHRADLVAGRAARALAALAGDPRPTVQDLALAVDLALAHRALGRPELGFGAPEESEAGGTTPSQPAAGEAATAGGASAEQGASGRADGEPADGAGREGSGFQSQPADSAKGAEGAPESPATFPVRAINLPRERRSRPRTGKRAAAESKSRRGRHVDSRESERVDDLALTATLRAAAPHQPRRRNQADTPVDDQRLMLLPHDLRQKVRRRRTGNLIVFVVDASASMDAEQRMHATRGAVLSLLQDAYVRRDRVALVVFRNRTAEVVLRPTSSVSLARRRMERLSVGGTTPLTHGLMEALKMVRAERRRDPDVRPLLVLISDGRGNISLFKEEPLVEAQRLAAVIAAEQVPALVIDSARDFSGSPALRSLARSRGGAYAAYTINACADLAERMGAEYHGLFDLSRDSIVRTVARRLQ